MIRIQFQTNKYRKCFLRFFDHQNNEDNDAIKMETEVRVLKQDLVRTQEALKAATKKCRDLVRELDNRNSNQASERNLRDQQLSRILRALLVLESRLKQEQKSIRQLLCEKDNVIRNQQLEIAKLRRYTKNYIKGKRDSSLGQSISVEESIPPEKNSSNFQVDEYNSKRDSSLSKDIENLKCEIITKLNGSNSQEIHNDHSRGITKTHSFAGSDISKTSLTSSENTDASIITTTTEGSPSLLSTEGFCEGESTDVSPGSTLNKSSRCTPTTVTTDSENEIMTILNDDDDDETMMNDEVNRFSKRRFGVLRAKPLKMISSSRIHELPKIIRTESTDDGMDLNFVSDEEERHEPIYVNSCTENNVRNLQGATRTNEDCSNNNVNIISKIEPEEQNQEDTSGNWYSDPDEDRISDDVFRHTTYRPNGNHNSVLECVNQILLRDMEEDEKVLSIPRRFKHRGKIVRFQPARLSDIESVGSEMERRNSEEAPIDGDISNEIEPSDNDTESGAFEATTSEDEFGMRHEESSSEIIVNTIEPEANIDENEKPRPIVIIEPKIEHEENQKKPLSFVLPQKVKGSPNLSPTLKMERIEEKTCLQMSSKGLTLAKNLDYEDIESLPEMISPLPKTPPALPPKPQFMNNTLVLKKIPSPSFLIDETRKKNVDTDTEQGKNLFPFTSPIKTTSVKSLKFDEESNKSTSSESSLWKNRFNNVRSSFKSKHGPNNKDEQRKIPRVTNIVRHFEEFKIGGDNDERLSDRIKPRERHVLVSQFDEDFDIRQNFEEFNLDDCDLSDDPDRPEGDGSETLTSVGVIAGQTENTIIRNKDNNNIVIPIDNSNNGYDHFLEATGLSTKSILTPSRLLSNHKSMLKPKDIKYKNMIKSNAVLEKHGPSHTHVRHWTGPFV
ncbi:probable serine/threonine-protein kinase DDB_G0278845 isoform X2 [Leptopilina boulardi]|uniref:probable serine/threonine-protein kinase DDB_G0278845 isoform X2 n=2 Tax=Leptopilina boulardi TaxID=63433 RepID=UPI0021F64D2D|nr:probable serine/threonine-protein kinase DDB_G0278845 isoform X2 [Leptopilina boulardi]